MHALFAQYAFLAKEFLSYSCQRTFYTFAVVYGNRELLRRNKLVCTAAVHETSYYGHQLKFPLAGYLAKFCTCLLTFLGIEEQSAVVVDAQSLRSWPLNSIPVHA